MMQRMMDQISLAVTFLQQDYFLEKLRRYPCHCANQQKLDLVSWNRMRKAKVHFDPWVL